MRNYGKQTRADLALGRWIRENPGRPFALMTAEGMYKYKGEFVSSAEMNNARIEQEGIKQLFTYDEAQHIDMRILDELKPSNNSGGTE